MALKENFNWPFQLEMETNYVLVDSWQLGATLEDGNKWSGE